MRTYHNEAKQAIVKRNILEWVSVGGKVIWEYKQRCERKISEEEEIKIPKCSRKSHVETLNEETKESSSEEKEIGIHNYRRRSQVYIMNKGVKVWTSSSKQQGAPTEITNTKEDICLEHIKIKVKRSALEWDDFMLQEQFKSLMYVDRSFRGDPKK